MGREIQKKKNRSPLPKIRQRRESRAKMRNPRGNSIVAAHWDNSETLSQNYHRLGLVSKLNSRAGGTERRGAAPPEALDLGTHALNDRKGTKEVRVERDPTTGAILRILRDHVKDNPLGDPLRELDTDSDEGGSEASDVHATDVVQQLQAQASISKPKRARKQGQWEREWVERLVAKYGEDYSRMAWDMKLNPMQETEASIRRSVNLWKLSQANASVGS